MSTGAGNLGVLLSKITAVLNGMQPIREPSTKLRHLFRNVLFYCSLLGFNSSYLGKILMDFWNWTLFFRLVAWRLVQLGLSNCCQISGFGGVRKSKDRNDWQHRNQDRLVTFGKLFLKCPLYLSILEWTSRHAQRSEPRVESKCRCFAVDHPNGLYSMHLLVVGLSNRENACSVLDGSGRSSADF